MPKRVAGTTRRPAAPTPLTASSAVSYLTSAASSLPATGSCEALARAARAHGVLRDEPYVGDIFLLYSRTRARFIHTGIVVGVQEEERVHERDVHVCVTVEGNTNDDGSSNGHTTLRKVRTFREVDGHRFVRRVEMGRGVVA